MTRRDLLKVAVAVTAVPLRIAAACASPSKSLRIAIVADLHHGLAPDAASRLQAFIDETLRRSNIDLAIQMGDFCYSDSDSAPVLEQWKRLSMPTLHVLGNHDMDKCDKDTAMKLWGMKSRYGSHVVGGYRFVVLDLNHFRKDGKLVSYANGNYFTEGASCNWADPEQLDWLEKELARSKEPVIVLSHQPLGFAEPGGPLPPEQAQVLKVIAASGKVALCLCGHMHVDRLESYEGIPCYCVNSASYFWYGGMNPYTKPLFAFAEITPEGEMVVEGASGAFVKPPPAASDSVIGRSASIGSRRISIHAHGLRAQSD